MLRKDNKGQVMKHICETMRDYIDAMTTSMQGDVILCSEELWKQIHSECIESRPERSKREDSKYGMKAEIVDDILTMENGKKFDIRDAVL